MNKSIDEIFKDSSPIDTVSGIKELLLENGLTLQEDWFEQTVSNCHCVRLYLNNTTLFTSGKGITRELANASAHGELMERLQCGMLGYGDTHYTDAVMMDADMLADSCDSFFDIVAAIGTRFEPVPVTPDVLMNACFDYEDGGKLTEAIPYYSATDDKKIYIPERLLMPLFQSTGHCAGNSAEEAIVQGFSEIVERWNQRHFMCLDLVPPTIPDSYLQNYPIAYQTITEIKNAGYDVIIKDCSMGTDYPVIATAVIDKKKHAYHVHLGASPVFEIALNRSLTETFQGRMLTTVADTDLSDSAKADASIYRKAYRFGRGAYPMAFFTENSSFAFKPFTDRTKCSNQELLAYVYHYITERNMKLYIRDESHFGFHAYHVIVPDMCSAAFDTFTLDIQVPKLVGATKAIQLDLKNATEDQLFALQLLNCYKINNRMFDRDAKCSLMMRIPIASDVALDRAVGYIHIGYVEWQCGNKNSTLNYARMIQAQKVPGISDYFSCLSRAYSMLKTNPNLSEVLSMLSIFYNEDTVNEVRDVLENEQNPFANYVVSCYPHDGSCDSCRYKNTCDVQKRMYITKIFNEKIAKFDNAQAFAKLQQMFQKFSQ